MTPSSTATIGHLPVYESLVRERGDVVAEARLVAQQTLHQAAQGLAGHAVVPLAAPAASAARPGTQDRPAEGR
nr:hypothetical protein [Streptomyces sp.]